MNLYLAANSVSELEVLVKAGATHINVPWGLVLNSPLKVRKILGEVRKLGVNLLLDCRAEDTSGYAEFLKENGWLSQHKVIAPVSIVDESAFEKFCADLPVSCYFAVPELSEDYVKKLASLGFTSIYVDLKAPNMEQELVINAKLLKDFAFDVCIRASYKSAAKTPATEVITSAWREGLKHGFMYRHTFGNVDRDKITEDKVTRYAAEMALLGIKSEDMNALDKHSVNLWNAKQYVDLQKYLSATPTNALVRVEQSNPMTVANPLNMRECNTCKMAASCKQFKTDSECSILDAIDFTKDGGLAVQTLVSMMAARAGHAMLVEMENGMLPQKETTEAITKTLDVVAEFTRMHNTAVHGGKQSSITITGEKLLAEVFSSLARNTLKKE